MMDADQLAAQLKAARKTLAWIYLVLGACVIILMVDLMLKRQLGRLAVEVSRAGTAAGQRMAAPPDDPDIGGGDGGGGVDGAAPQPADDGDAGDPGAVIPRAPRGGPGRRAAGDGQ